MDLLQILIDCYNRNDFSNVLGVLSKDCSYASQWVFEEMQGSEQISEYLIAKTDTIAKYHAFPTAKKARILSPYFGRECIALYQGDLNNPACIIIIESENEKITRIDICMPELFRFELV